MEEAAAPRAPVRRRRRAAPEGRPEAPEGRPEAGSGGQARHTPRRRPRGSRRRRERSVQCWGTIVFGHMLLCAKKETSPLSASEAICATLVLFSQPLLGKVQFSMPQLQQEEEKEKKGEQ